MFDNQDRALTGIVIDPGNGGNDTGSTGNGIVEKDMNLKISEYMANRFKELGIPVTLTRTTDTDLDATTRTQKALNAYGNSNNIIVISNHINSGAAEGAEVIYALRNTDQLSNKILNNLAQEGQITNKNYQRRLPTDPSKDYYAIIRDTPNTEAIIVQYGYTDNKNDAERLKENYQNYAEAVVRAVADHKNIKYIPPKNGNDYYTVQSGDTLWTISRKFGLTVNELKVLNNLTSNTLSIGQVLKVSKTTPSTDAKTTTTYTVKSGDTLWKIAQNYNTSVDKIKSLNNLTSNNLSIGQTLKIPSTEEPTIPTQNTIKYTVQSGDTLWKIANRFNIAVDKLKDFNNLNSNNLQIGQILTIPTTSKYTTYTVVRGDTLYLIATKNNISVDKLKTLNNLSSNNIMIGQKLLIPLT